MGYKAIKDFYQIGHIVHVDNGIWIGSPMCSRIIKVTKDGATISHSTSNKDLNRYLEEMNADLPKLRELIDQEDVFERSLPVFTYKDGEVVEKFCEEYGWPRCTHDGEEMYENTFTKDRNQAVKWAIEDAKVGVSIANRRIEERREELLKWFKRKEEAMLIFEKAMLL